MKGTKLSGKIKGVIRDFESVEWVHGQPAFIIVELDDGRTVSCTRNQVLR